MQATGDLYGDMFEISNFRKEDIANITGKSLSAALIFTSTNPQYDKWLFIGLPVQYMKTTSPEHVVYINCFICQNKKQKHH